MYLAGDLSEHLHLHGGVVPHLRHLIRQSLGQAGSKRLQQLVGSTRGGEEEKEAAAAVSLRMG